MGATRAALTTDPERTPDPAVPRRLRGAVWALAVAALVLPVLGVVAVAHVLTGGVDEQYFTNTEYDGDGNVVSSTTSASVSERWEALDYLVPVDRLLVGPVAVLLLLAGLHLAGRGRPAVPGGARLVAVLAAVVSFVTALTGGLVPLYLRQRASGDDDPFGAPSPLATLVGSAGALVFLLAACVLAVVLLLQRPLPPSAAVDVPTLAPREDQAPSTGAPTRAPDGDPPPEQVPVRAPVDPPPVPRLSEEDRAWYRRPTP